MEQIQSLPEQEERALLRRALAMQRMRESLAAELDRPAVLEQVLGRRPLGGSVQAHDWDRAADFARRRWIETGWQPPADASSVDDLLGPAPTDLHARRGWELVEHVHQATISAEVDFGVEW